MTQRWRMAEKLKIIVMLSNREPAQVVDGRLFKYSFAICLLCVPKGKRKHMDGLIYVSDLVLSPHQS